MYFKQIFKQYNTIIKINAYIIDDARDSNNKKNRGRKSQN